MPSLRLFHLVIISTVLAASLWIGFSIALIKPLWLDEIYTQIKDVQAPTVQEIWSGQLIDRSNLPLFFSIQKVIGKVLHYRSKTLWDSSTVTDRLITRICPVVFMSLTITMITWYFLTLEGLAGAGLALLLLLTSYMVWGYWAESRPYAMMLWGTAFQAIALDKYLNCKPPRADTRMLCASHWFLALTSAISIIQITAAGIVMWLTGMRQTKKIIFCTILPIIIILAFYSQVTPCKMWYSPHSGPLNLLAANIHPTRLLIIFLISVILLARTSFFKKPVDQRVWYFTLWVGLMLAGHALLMAYMKMLASPTEAGAAEVSNRYFIPLTAVGIMGTLILSFELLRQARDQRLKWLIWIIILVITLPRLGNAYNWATAMHIFE